MKLFMALLLLIGAAVVIANPAFKVEDVEDQLQLSTDDNDDDEPAIERDRRSNLMAQILYEELRLKLKDQQGKHGPSNRRVVASSYMRKRRSTTPVRDLLSQLTEGNAVSYSNDAERNGDIAELEEEIDTLSRRLMKRSLMAMILKDTLKQRVEDENKPGRHREIVWGKSVRKDDTSSSRQTGSFDEEESPIAIVIRPKTAMSKFNLLR